MSFLKSLFGREAAPAAAKIAAQAEHNGYLIEAAPYREEGQYQVAGTISKVIDGVRKEHRFVRADRFATLEDAASIAIAKGRQIIDQQGERIFK